MKNPHYLSAAGVFCAGLLLAEVNVLASRHYARIDVSRESKYTLSEPTRQVVSSLTSPIELVVLLGEGDPLLAEVKHLVTSYEALSPQLKVRYLDPDRDVAEILALERNQEVSSHAVPEGSLFTGAAIFLRKDARTWIIRGGQLSELDADGNLRLRIEARLSEGIAQLLTTNRQKLCFVTGHGERSIDDAASEGLLELSKRLRSSNIDLERVPLDVPDPEGALSSCENIAVVGPERPWPEQHAAALKKRIESGVSLALFLDPIVDAQGYVAEPGLSDVLSMLEVETGQTFVLETDPKQRLPGGIGETFFAQPKPHPITRGLSTDEARVDARVVMAAARPLVKTSGSSAVTLLETSTAAVTISNLNEPQKVEAHQQPLSLAMAGKLANKKRWIVVGSSQLIENASFRDPALYGGRTFAESSFAWLLDTQTLVSVPERPPMKAGIRLSEESLGDLLRYVLIYMPLSAMLAGAYVLWRRKKHQDASHPQTVVKS